MCGIAGVIDSTAPVDGALIHRMCAAMEHRGPDSRGVHLEDGVGLGAQRLAIIDVAAGPQPMSNETGDVVVVFNGEIYNHEELRRDLVRRGHHFASSTDTEVIVHLYEDLGAALVTRLRGMFAFAVWDRRRRRVVCARDRVGKKPLFWTRRGGRFSFASELGALLQDETIERRIDHEAIGAYLGLQYVPHPLCAVRGVRKLPPACTLVLEPGGSERVERYWKLSYTPKHTGMARQELEEKLRSRLDEATRIRLQSDVPLGAMLSGGIDSSAVVASMAAHTSGPVKTFSIGFDDHDHDETPFARRVAEHFGTDHHELHVRPEAVAMLPKMARHYGEPFGDSSALPSFHLAQLAAEHVTVALNGDGGDESFGGYERYSPPPRLAAVGRVPRPARRLLAPVLRLAGEGTTSRSLRSRAHRLARLLAMDRARTYATSMCVFDAAARRALVEPGFGEDGMGPSAEDFLVEAWYAVDSEASGDRMMGVDSATYLPGDLLVKMDIATMAHSVEARSPFLDQELMEFAAALPADLKLGESGGKEILRAALRGVLPDDILDRPKMGFAVPLGRWLRESLAGLPGEILLDPGTRTLGYLRRGEVERTIHEHESGMADHSIRIWVLLALETWHREVLDAPPSSA